jgi:hypothetical protein
MTERIEQLNLTHTKLTGWRPAWLGRGAPQIALWWRPFGRRRKKSEIDVCHGCNMQSEADEKSWRCEGKCKLWAGLAGPVGKWRKRGMADLMTHEKFQAATPLPLTHTDLTQRCRESQGFASNSQHHLFAMCYWSKVLDSPINLKLYEPFCATVELVVLWDIKKELIEEYYIVAGK